MEIKNKNQLLFEEKLKVINAQISNYEGRSSLLSTLRAVSFFVGAALLIVGLSDKISVALCFGIILLVFFLALVKYHELVADRLLRYQSEREAVEHYIMRFDDRYKQLPRDGSEYLMPEDVVAKDLDLLGKASVFQLINVCHTKKAEEKLANSLKANELAQDMENMNVAVEELMADIDGAVSFEGLGIKSEKNKKNKGGKLFFEFCGSEKSSLPAWAYAISLVLPIAELALIIMWITGVTGYGYAIAGFLILLSFAGLTKNITDLFVAPMLTASVLTRDYISRLEQLESSDFQSEYLKNMKEKVSEVTRAFKKLGSISEAYKLSFNPVIYTVLNGIFLWDYRLAKLAQGWKEKHGESAGGCEDIIADMEYMRSLAVIGIVRDTAFADIKSKEEATISFEELYHPLIPPDKAVSNSAKITSGITIITGSNMSGKTTFLRTVSVNLVLAYMGAPVCAKHFAASYMKLFTSMRVSDDVANGISTFYAEILRIKSMAEYRNANKPMLCMIDEIFKGTNSADRIVGATEAIRRLSGKNSIAMVSTHDFELCEVADTSGEPAKNYHFEEYYEGDRLLFDYHLKGGKCTTTNAKAILRMAGFNV